MKTWQVFFEGSPYEEVKADHCSIQNGGTLCFYVNAVLVRAFSGSYWLQVMEKN